MPGALDKADVSVDQLDSILDNALLVGNGDINALVYNEGGKLALRLTKNDVWDARLEARSTVANAPADQAVGD